MDKGRVYQAAKSWMKLQPRAGHWSPLPFHRSDIPHGPTKVHNTAKHRAKNTKPHEDNPRPTASQRTKLKAYFVVKSQICVTFI